MVNKALRLVTLIFLSIPLLFVVPFNNIYAEYVVGGSPIIGVNIKYRDINTDYEPYQLTASLEMPHRWQCVSSHSTMGCQVWSSQDTSGNIQDEITGTINVSSSAITTVLYEYEFVLDKSYVGWINFSQPLSTTQFNQYFVNGTSFTLTSPSLITTFTVTNYHLEYAPLDVINKTKQFDIPFESFSYVSWFLYKNYEIVDIGDNNSYISGYPSFYIPKYNYVAQSYINQNSKILLIFVSDIQAGLINSYINFNNGNFTSTREFVQIGRGGTGQYLTLYKYIITNNGANANYQPSVQGSAPNDIYFVPILNVTLPYNNYSTDFALRYGLSNTYLDNIQLIANGTTASSSAAQSSDSANSQLQQDSNTLFSQEDSFKQNMNSAMQNIDTTFTLNNFGQSFMTSAQWVRSQYETLTNNTPFASLITFSLLVGLALIVIGKVYK